MVEQNKFLSVIEYCKKYHRKRQTIYAACKNGYIHATRNKHQWLVEDEPIDKKRRLHFFACIDASYGVYDLEEYFCFTDALFRCEYNNWIYEVDSPRSWDTDMFVVVSEQ